MGHARDNADVVSARERDCQRDNGRHRKQLVGVDEDAALAQILRLGNDMLALAVERDPASGQDSLFAVQTARSIPTGYWR